MTDTFEKGHLKNGHSIQLNHFTCRSVSLEGALHEAPVPEFVDYIGWTGVDFKNLQGKATGKGCNKRPGEPNPPSHWLGYSTGTSRAGKSVAGYCFHLIKSCFLIFSVFLPVPLRLKVYLSRLIDL